MTSIDRLQPPLEVELKHQSPRLREAIIMMVDDEPLMLDILKLHLFDEGYRNFIAVDQSTEALDILRTELPDVVFLDINMPEVDGFEILRAIRSDPQIQHLAVIILTSHTDSETKLKALQLGATDFLEKPIDTSELALRLHNTLTVKAYQDRLAYYDGLTGLPNRSLFTNRVGTALAHAVRTKAGLSVMKISMDRFQTVNDSLGPLVGDEVLKRAAERLRTVIRMVDANRSVDTVRLSASLARTGGDEFSVLLPGVVADEELMGLGEQIMETMREPFDFQGDEFYSTVSVGIARHPKDSIETDELIKHAGAACELAKEKGRNNCQFYSSEITRRADERRNLEADLHKAVERGEFQLHYQPQLDTGSGKVVGMECLVRWRHPERGLVQPDEFVPLAEENGLILEIGEWVLNEACRQTQAWHEQGMENLSVSVNLSARQFRHPDIVKLIRDACSESGLNPQQLVVELTEGLVMDDVDRAAKLLQGMKEIGVSISVDDFGTGYSSLAYLKRFPIDELKIDRSFIRDVPSNEDDNAIVNAVVAMAHSLGLKVVAEGVETEAQLEYLREAGCDEIQGMFHCAPLTASEFEDFVGGKQEAGNPAA